MDISAVKCKNPIATQGHLYKITVFNRKRASFRGGRPASLRALTSGATWYVRSPPHIIPSATRGERGVGRCVAFPFFSKIQIRKMKYLANRVSK
jgi:hypothetical protein